MIIAVLLAKRHSRYSMIEIVTVLLSLSGLGIAWLNFLTTTRISTAQLQQAVLNTRPYIRASSVLSDLGPMVGYRNFGHSPADLVTSIYGKFFTHELTANSYATSLYYASDLQTPHGDSRVIFIPANTGDETSNSIPKEILWPDQLADLNGNFTFANSAQFEAELKIHTLYLWGAFLYRDAAGILHEGKFCYYHRPTDSKELFFCDFANVSDEPVAPGDCVRPQIHSNPLTHRLPCASEL